MRKKRELIYQGLTLILLCSNIVITFTLIYIFLDVIGLGEIVDHHTISYSRLDHLVSTLYFSAITLFSVGYGDITPLHWSRIVAILEASVGYILPAIITAQYLRLVPPRVEKIFKKTNKNKN